MNTFDTVMGAAIGIALVILFAIMQNSAYKDGQEAVRQSVLSDCANFKAFVYKDKIYDCKERS